MTRAIAALFLFVNLAAAQFPPKAAQYLELTESQAAAMESNRQEHMTWLWDKTLRMDQVYREIGEERAKPSPEPMALGLRYLEIEAICRQMAEKAVELRTKNQQILAPAQRAKLKVLEDALALAPVIIEAQQSGLLAEPLLSFGSFSTGDRFNRTDGTRLGASNGCGGPVAAVIQP